MDIVPTSGTSAVLTYGSGLTWHYNSNATNVPGLVYDVTYVRNSDALLRANHHVTTSHTLVCPFETNIGLCCCCEPNIRDMNQPDFLCGLSDRD